MMLSKSALFFIVILASGSTPGMAESKASPQTHPKTASFPSEFTRQAQTFYKQHMAAQTQLQNRKRLILKKISGLNFQRQDTKNPDDFKKIQEQLNTEQNQLRLAHYDIARHDVETAEFGVQMAQHRLAVTRQHLANLEKSSPDLKKKS